MKKILCTVLLLSLLAGTFVLTGCSKKSTKKNASYNPQNTNRIVIWTSCSEFVQYVELFNKTHKTDNAVLVYKDNPALNLPPEKDELPPDIIVGSWLNAQVPSKNFKPLSYIFDYKELTSEMFYPQLLEVGKVNNTPYLLPVSFNLPAIVFSSDNRKLITDNYTLSLDEIRKIGTEYNQKNKKDTFTRIGFAPLGSDDFLYLVTKLNGVNFRSEKNQIVWNKIELEQTESYLRDWVNTSNESAKTEEDFTFKYLFMPYYRQVTSGRTLFSYTTSDQLFKVMKDQSLNIDYRWLYNEKSIPIEDSFMMMGIYKKAQNQVGATEFITWFFQSENQKHILERKESLNLETEMFGIAGGFSAIRDVTEHILPLYYTSLLSNLPPSQMITVCQKLPVRWESYRDLVVEPYIRAAIESPETCPTFEYLEKEWTKKVFD